MNVIIFHFLFRISGAELSALTVVGGDGLEKGTGYTTAKLTKFFDAQKRFPSTKAHISILKAMCGDKDYIIGGECTNYSVDLEVDLSLCTQSVLDGLQATHATPADCSWIEGSRVQVADQRAGNAGSSTIGPQALDSDN
jgi:hypothetical protein